MEHNLSQIRDKIIKDGFDVNKNVGKAVVAKAFSEKLPSVPTMYRILDGRIVDSQISQLEVIDKAIKKHDKR